MDEFILQPGIYKTGQHEDLFSVLDQLWPAPADVTYEKGATYYIVSGFGTFNGGVRFYERFRQHVAAAGRVRVILGGSRSQNLSSRQLAAELLDVGAQVSVVNRRRIMHGKLYGSASFGGKEQRLVSTSGNFTSPGLLLNIESIASLGASTVRGIGFSWEDAFESMANAGLEHYDLTQDPGDPAWELLYDEAVRGARPADEDSESEYESMIMTLSHSDTVRINAQPGTHAYRGTQYFWLSKDAYGFFPALTIKNQRGRKATYSTLVSIHFDSLNETHELRVTFEAENNLDFRLGTGPLRGTRLAAEGDIAVLARRGDANYDLYLVRQGTRRFEALRRYAQHFVGHQGKRYGYATNSVVDQILKRKS